jgi:hypothetical protein
MPLAKERLDKRIALTTKVCPNQENNKVSSEATKDKGALG